MMLNQKHTTIKKKTCLCFSNFALLLITSHYVSLRFFILFNTFQHLWLLFTISGYFFFLTASYCFLLCSQFVVIVIWYASIVASCQETHNLRRNVNNTPLHVWLHLSVNLVLISNNWSLISSMVAFQEPKETIKYLYSLSVSLVLISNNWLLNLAMRSIFVVFVFALVILYTFRAL